MNAKLLLKDGLKLEGESFGYEKSRAGEIVFATGMTGYPQAFTDPSFEGQILVLTYPLIGNYGVPAKGLWESDKPHIAGLIVSDYIGTPSHFQSEKTLSDWLKEYKIPALIIKDTRFLAQHLRDKGAMLGKIIIDTDINWYDPNADDLLNKVSVSKPSVILSDPERKSDGESKDPLTTVQEILHYVQNDNRNRKTVLLIDCGAKKNIERCFLKREVSIIKVPWNYDVFGNKSKLKFDALFISNGPGDPKMATATIDTIKTALENNIPTLGICLGNQLLALAAGGDTYKLKFGHRSQNQPCLLAAPGQPVNRCFITTQNHGFAVGKIPDGFKPWFVNANDDTNEGIIHECKPFMSVQFHPEAAPGPMDTEWIFDFFLERIGSR